MDKENLLNVEFVLEDNLEVILRLNQTVHDKHYQNNPDVFNPYHPEKFKPWFDRFIKKENRICILVKKDEKYIGYALVVHRKKSASNPFINANFESLYIDQMSIEKEYQNQGVGRKLIEYIKTIALERGIRKIQLDVWSGNYQAKEFYEKNHFHTIREIMEIQLS